MLARIVQLALSQRLLTLLLAALLLGFGLRAMWQLPIDAFPDLSPTQVQIIIQAPGMTPEEVEAQITQPLEIELLGIPRQTILRSNSQYALAAITMDFAEGTDNFWARQQVSERLNNIWNELPDDIGGGLAPMSTPLGEMFMFTIESEALDLEARRYLLDWTVRPALRSVAGVADVNALGGYVRSYEVTPDPMAMAQFGVSSEALIRALEDNNRNDGAGRIDQGEEALLVRVTAAVRDIADIAGIHVDTAHGIPVNIGRIAEVRVSALQRYGSVTSNGNEEAVQALVIGMAGANAREVLSAVKQRLSELESSLPAGTYFDIFYDRSELIEEAVSTVSMALLQAIVLVIIVLGLFFGNVRAALTAATILPLSALATFLIMDSMSMSANLMSLGGLIIAIGMLVDSAIVIVENSVTTLNRGTASTRLPRLHLIYRAVKEVAVPVTAGVGIIIIVFLPLLSLEGLEGKLFGPVTLTIIFALVSSLLLALTVIPVIASFLLGSASRQEPWLARQLQRVYAPLLQRAMAAPAYVLALAAALLAISLAIFPFVGKTFMPVMDEGDIVIQLEMLPSINLDNSTRLVLRIEQALMAEVPEIRRIVSRTGSDELGMDPMPLSETDMFLQLHPGVPLDESLETRLRLVMERFRGINYSFTMPIDMRISEMLTGARGDLAIKLFGSDLEQLNNFAQQISTIVATLPGAVDTTATLNEGEQYLQVRIDRVMAGTLGINAAQLQRRLRAQVEGLHVGTVLESGARIPLMIRFPTVSGDALNALQNMLIALPDGNVIALASVATIERMEGPVSISRERGQRFALITSNITGRDLVGFVEQAQQEVAAQLTLPQGYTLEWGGEFENQQRAAARLGMVVPVAVCLIALILFLTFQSVKQAVIILANIPFAMTGGLIALWLSGEYLSVPAAVGFIALLGIAVLNGVVLMSHFNHLAAKGLAVTEVACQGALRRLRPVMMTATTSAAGLSPLLLASGPGSEIQRPLAIVVIGGLVSATLLTLFLLPIIYRHFHQPSKQ